MKQKDWPFKNPSLAVDGVVLTKDNKVVIIQRKNTPLGYALPGGFVEYGEAPEKALVREMKEELGVKVRIKKLIGVFWDPHRDPRGHIVSIAYLAQIISWTPIAGDDAKAVKVMDFKHALKTNLVCDHNDILKLCRTL